jgi:hypothetical protein
MIGVIQVSQNPLLASLSEVVNYCKNPSFEVNVTDDWVFAQGGAGGSANLDATQYKVGAKSCRIRASNASWGSVLYSIGFSVPNGATVSASAWLRCSANPTGNKACIQIQEAGVAVRATAYATVASSGAWEYLTCSWTNNLGVAHTTMISGNNIFNDSAADVWFDACQLELGVASDYCDGAQYNCYWTGAAHNSTSGRISTSTRESFALDLTPGRRRRHFSVVRGDLRRIGGFYECTFTMHDTPLNLEDFYWNALGRQVLAVNEHGGVDFEGVITEMRKTGPTGDVEKISLEQVVNKCLVRYKDSGGTFARSTAYQDLDSQAQFGILEFPVSGGQIESTTTAYNLGRMVVERRRWPRSIPEDQRLGGRSRAQGVTGRASIEVRASGYWWYLTRRTYNQTASTGTQSADLQVADILAACGQFVRASRLTVNPLGVRKDYDSDRTPADILSGIAGLGDALEPPMPFCIGMWENRTVVYEPLAPCVDIVIG